MGSPRFYITPMLVADIDYREFKPGTLILLKSKAEYVDTDESLNEFLVSTGSIAEAIELAGNDEVYFELECLAEETAKYAYLRVLYA
jgi:hypothetical protein